ncbi:MAG TPA: FHA domain-containing protein, partial [Phototrophicaceae bacterium]|nr:FHA domain-containing protein [Phototrophicaceae bacterium]
GPDTDDDGAPAPAPADGPAPVVTHVPAAPAPAPSDLSAAAEASSTAEGAAPAGADAPSAGTPAAPQGPDGPRAAADTGAAARAADDAATADPSGAAVPGEESPEDSDDYDFLLWSTEEVQARQTPAPADGDDGPAPTDADAPAPPRPEPAAETTPAPDLEATRIPEPEPEDGGSPFAPPEGGIIDSVPGRPRPDAPVGAPVDLPPPSGAPAGPVDDGDHDGETLMTSDLPTPSAPLVAEPVVRAEPGVELVLSTGPRIEMDRPVLLGRAPEAARFAGSEVPRLVSVSNPERDISATHVEIRPAGGHVVVTDMNSTNGTVVHLPDQPSFRLQPGTGVPVAAGAVIELGTGVEVTVQPVEGAQ